MQQATVFQSRERSDDTKHATVKCIIVPRNIRRHKARHCKVYYSPAEHQTTQSTPLYYSHVEDQTTQNTPLYYSHVEDRTTQSTPLYYRHVEDQTTQRTPLYYRHVENQTTQSTPLYYRHVEDQTKQSTALCLCLQKIRSHKARRCVCFYRRSGAGRYNRAVTNEAIYAADDTNGGYKL